MRRKKTKSEKRPRLYPYQERWVKDDSRFKMPEVKKEEPPKAPEKPKS